MATLIFKLTAPLQSYGDQADFNFRTTNYYPSKSAILGIIAAALGYQRNDPKIKNLNQLGFAVRIDQPGKKLTDFQISTLPDKSKGTIISYRHYLQDSIFLVALEGPQDELTKIEYALHHPTFQLYLGRKSNPIPGYLETNITDQKAVNALENAQWTAKPYYQKENKKTVYLEIIADTKLTDQPETEFSKDKIISLDLNNRQYSFRPITKLQTKVKNPYYQEQDIFNFI